MKEREAARLAAAAAAPQASAQQAAPVLVPSPCGQKTGVMSAGRVAWIDNAGEPYQIMQDERLAHHRLVCFISLFLEGLT